MMLDTWTPEILAITLSTVCLVAIIVVLLVYNGKETPRLPYGITLNATISILATASRSLLAFTVAASLGQLKWCWYQQHERDIRDLQIYDDASRGPWGGLIMLFSMRIRPLASIGATIMILTLAVDPFVQQILTYPQRMIPEAAAPISKASTFMLDPLSSEFRNAIFPGAFSSPNQYDRQPSCPAKNCTWGPFKSTGWCSKCVDATPYARITHCDLTGISLEDYNYNSPNSKCLVDYGHGKTLRVLHPIPFVYGDTRDPVLTMDAVWALDDSFLSTTSSYNRSYLNINNPVLALGHVAISITNPEPSRISQLEIAHAEECVISLCEQEIEVAVRDSITSTHVISTDFGNVRPYEIHYINTDSDTHFAVTADWTCWTPNNGTSSNLTYGLTDANHCMIPDPSIPLFCATGLQSIDSNLPLNCSDPISFTGDTINYGQTLASDLVGNVSTVISGGTIDYSMSGLTTNISSPLAQYIALNNFSTVLSGVAASLTHSGLVANTSNTTDIPGTAEVAQVYVSVAWLWLILPLSLVAGTAVFCQPQPSSATAAKSHCGSHLSSHYCSTVSDTTSCLERPSQIGSAACRRSQTEKKCSCCTVRYTSGRYCTEVQAQD